MNEADYHAAIEEARSNAHRQIIDDLTRRGLPTYDRDSRPSPLLMGMLSALENEALKAHAAVIVKFQPNKSGSCCFHNSPATS